MDNNNIIRVDVENPNTEALIELLKKFKEGHELFVYLREGHKTDFKPRKYFFVSFLEESGQVLLSRRKNLKAQERLILADFAAIYYGLYSERDFWEMPRITYKGFFVRIQKMYDGIEDTLMCVHEAPKLSGNDDQIIYDFLKSFCGEEDFETPLHPDLSEKFESEDGCTVWWLDRYEPITAKEYERLYDLFYKYKY